MTTTAEVIPHNATTRQPYRGGNVGRLLAAQLEAGYETAEWAGFQQWRTLGRTVRKGEKGTHCLTVVVCADEKKRPRGFVVFNIAQTDALPEADAA